LTNRHLAHRRLAINIWPTDNLATDIWPTYMTKWFSTKSRGTLKSQFRERAATYRFQLSVDHLDVLLGVGHLQLLQVRQQRSSGHLESKANKTFFVVETSKSCVQVPLPLQSHSQSSLKFTDNLEAYPVLHSKGRFLDLTANIKLSWKWLMLTNAVAYYLMESITTENRFMVHTQGSCTLLFFMSAIFAAC